MALSPAERIKEMQRQLAETKTVLDGCVLHPSDADGLRMLREQQERNRKLRILVDDVAALIGEMKEGT